MIMMMMMVYLVDHRHHGPSSRLGSGFGYY